VSSQSFRRTAFSFAVCCCALGTFGCRNTQEAKLDADATEVNTQVARTDVERGPLRVSVQVEPNPARLSDEPTLTLTLDYEIGVQVEKPPFGEAVGDFQIRSFREPLPETRADREIVRQIYTLEPMRTGQLQVDPIPVTFTDNRPDGDGKSHTVETEALMVEVTSMVDAEAPTLDDLRGPVGPIALPAPRFSRLWLGVTCLLVFLAGGLGVGLWLLRRPSGEAVEQQLSPQELAYLELQQIIEQELSERDVKLFYVQLTGVVRRYIERTTGIHAPEQTTEEFLQEIQAGTVFSGSERERLSLFLESADLVKFAAHRPTANDVETTFERAKMFLGLAERGTES
jgi:hypothetical protein